MKKRNSNAMFNKLVNNKITLYVVAIIALISLFGYIMNTEFSAIILFFLIGGVAYSFTKNMTIVLGSAVIVTTVASMSRGFFVYQEGMKQGISGEDIETSETSGTSGTIKPSKQLDPSDPSKPSKPSKPSEVSEPKPEGLTQLTPALFNNIPNKDQQKNN